MRSRIILILIILGIVLFGGYFVLDFAMKKRFAPERIFWGEGDGVGLTAYQRPYGRISGLSCGEHTMLLPAYSLMAQGTQIHVAAWPFPRHISETSVVKALLLSRAFAVQGNCYVIAVSNMLRPKDVPESYRDLVGEKPDEEGGSCIIDPGGDVIVKAPPNEEGIVTATVSLEAVFQGKAVIDVGAHYSRPDVLQLHVNRHPLERIVEDTGLQSTSPLLGETGSTEIPGKDQSTGGSQRRKEKKETQDL